ncbi:hypothetical protein [Chryseobacterium turcicum]|uniref:Tetratricopeptide repeat protein n=1 Tax=Chryseobacterium turcicum TaxID=2898076 RepID=A0A9Q3YWI9_9FLAO|nr:hypothetical protein [Chryseobacterium turcicum]MCD1118019.1 hypothetical protein [Chryseobacterium turcicum]
MKKMCIAFFMTILINIPCFAVQIDEDILLKKANQEFYNNPNESIKIVKQLLKKEKNADKIIQLYHIISTAELTKGNLKVSLQYLLKARELVLQSNDVKRKTSFFITAALQYEQMELDAKTLESLDEGEQYLSKIPDGEYYKYFEVGRMNLVRGMISKKQNNPEIALKSFQDAVKSFEKITEVEKTYYNQSILFFYIGNCFLDLGLSEKAEIAFSKAYHLAIITNSNSLQSYALKGLSQIKKIKHQNLQALEYLKNAENKSEKTYDSTLLEEIYKEMADNYLVMGNQNYYQLYSKKLQELQFKREQLELSSINESMNAQNKNAATKIEELSSKNKNSLILSITMGCTICLGIFLWAYKLMIRNKKSAKEIQKLVQPVS